MNDHRLLKRKSKGRRRTFYSCTEPLTRQVNKHNSISSSTRPRSFICLFKAKPYLRLRPQALSLYSRGTSPMKLNSIYFG